MLFYPSLQQAIQLGGLEFLVGDAGQEALADVHNIVVEGSLRLFSGLLLCPDLNIW